MNSGAAETVQEQHTGWNGGGLQVAFWSESCPNDPTAEVEWAELGGDTCHVKHSQMNPLLSISTVMVYSFYFCPCLGQKAHCCVPSSGFPSLWPLIHQSILHTAAWMNSIQFNSSSHIFVFKILQLLPIAFRTKPKLLSLTSKAFHVQ